jgi:hypothetical protein
MRLVGKRAERGQHVAFGARGPIKPQSGQQFPGGVVRPATGGVEQCGPAVHHGDQPGPAGMFQQRSRLAQHRLGLVIPLGRVSAAQRVQRAAQAQRIAQTAVQARGPA